MTDYTAAVWCHCRTLSPGFAFYQAGMQASLSALRTGAPEFPAGTVACTACYDASLKDKNTTPSGSRGAARLNLRRQ